MRKSECCVKNDRNEKGEIILCTVENQLYTSFFNRLSDTSFPGYLFEGGIANLLPICRTDTCLSEIFYHIGVIMAHSLCQGVRPLRLCEAAYHYLING